MATLSENIGQVIMDLDGIKEAIVQKGQSIPFGTPTSAYMAKILAIEGGGGPPVEGWRPNPKWRTMPEMPPAGEQKIHCIVGLNEASPHYSLSATTASGMYRIDWGDGQTTEHTSNDTASHIYDLSTLDSEVTIDGFKTALVTITAATPGNLRLLRFTSTLSSLDTRAIKTSFLFYVRGRVPNITQVIFGTSSSTASTWRNGHLECVDLVDTNGITSYASSFQNCTNLRSISQLDTQNCTNFSSMFSSATSLKEVPQMDISKGTSIGSLFYGCSSLVKAHINNLNATSASSIFANCFSLSDLRITGGGALTSDLAINDLSLSRTSLVDIFNGLADRTGSASRGINITGNPGASQLTAADRAIATNKNWVITG